MKQVMEACFESTQADRPRISCLDPSAANRCKCARISALNLAMADLFHDMGGAKSRSRTRKTDERHKGWSYRWISRRAFLGSREVRERFHILAHDICSSSSRETLPVKGPDHKPILS